MANPLQFDMHLPTRPECQHCQELLADAVDNLLEGADQARFDQHVATCDDCSAAFADAVRGAAWLHVLKSPRPEPTAQLLDRILSATSGAATSEAEGRGTAEAPQPAFQPIFSPLLRPALLEPHAAVLEPVRPAANVLPFRPRVPHWGAIQRVMFEPRLAMTAAMAFFSIALTMNLTGVRLNELHASNLKQAISPTGIRRQYFETTAAVARRTESLRVVHVVEARVADFRDLTHTDGPADAPAPKPRRAPQPEKKSTPDPNGVSRGNPATPRFVPVTIPMQTPHHKGGLA